MLVIHDDPYSSNQPSVGTHNYSNHCRTKSVHPVAVPGGMKRVDEDAADGGCDGGDRALELDCH